MIWQFGNGQKDLFDIAGSTAITSGVFRCDFLTLKKTLLTDPLKSLYFVRLTLITKEQ